MCPFIFFCLFVATLFGWDRFWKRWENPWKILALETRVNWSNAEYWHTPSVSIPCDLSWTKHCVQLRDQRGRGFCGALDLCRFPVFSHTGCTFKMGPHQTCQAKRILCQDISFWLTDLSVISLELKALGSHSDWSQWRGSNASRRMENCGRFIVYWNSLFSYNKEAI